MADDVKPPDDGEKPDNVLPFNGAGPDGPPPENEGGHEPPKDGNLERIGENLRGMHDRAGVPPPETIAKSAPGIYVGVERNRPPPDEFCRELSALLRTRGLFIRNKVVGKINENTGEFEMMTPHDLVTWVPDVAGVVPFEEKKFDPETGREKMKKGAIGIEQARIFLASTDLKAKLPVIEHVNLVPLPVYRDELDERKDPKRKGFRKIELLRPGYDASTKTFTCHSGILLDEKTEPIELCEWALKILKTFDWSGKDEKGFSDRMAAHLAMQISVFARHLFVGKIPGFFYTSNQEGSGKGVLILWCLQAVFRFLGPMTIDPFDRKELINGLNTIANSGTEYLFADELPPDLQLRDPNIARWLTTKWWENRGMGQNQVISKVKIEKMLTVFAQNRGKLDRNLARRFIQVDLFMHQSSTDKRLAPDTILLEDEWFGDDENLNKILSLSWAMIRMWDNAGRPKSKDPVRKSFESWSRIVPAIVENAGFGRPLATFDEPGSGDDDTRELKKLARALFDKHLRVEQEDGSFTWKDREMVMFGDIMTCARLNGLFEDKLMSVDDVLRILNNRKGFKWEDVPLDATELKLAGEKRTMSDPDEEDKRLQAAGYSDEKIGSAFGKYFKKHAAVDGIWFEASNGTLYQFGDKGNSRGSRYLLQRVQQP